MKIGLCGGGGLKGQELWCSGLVDSKLTGFKGFEERESQRDGDLLLQPAYNPLRCNHSNKLNSVCESKIYIESK